MCSFRLVVVDGFVYCVLCYLVWFVLDKSWFLFCYFLLYVMVYCVLVV